MSEHDVVRPGRQRPAFDPLGDGRLSDEREPTAPTGVLSRDPGVHDLRDNVELALDVESVDGPGFVSDAALGDVLDPVLLLEGTTEENACWQQVSELELDKTVLAVRQARTVALGYVHAMRAGRDRDDVVGELMGTYSVSRRAAESELADALVLAAHPRTMTAALGRQFGLRQLRALTDVLAALEPEVADRVELAMLAKLPGRDPARIREMARTIALRLDPDAAVRRRKEAAKRRAVWLRDAGDGMVELTLLVRAEHGLAVLHRAESATRAGDGTGRTRDQRRADWVVEQLLRDPAASGEGGADPDAGPNPTGSGPGTGDAARPVAPAAVDPSFTDPVTGTGLVLDGRRQRPTQILVHVPVATALGLTDDPGHLGEVGPIDADHARLLLTTAELRKVCVEQRTGEVLAVDGTVHRPVADPRRVRQLRRAGHDEHSARARAQAEAVRRALLEMVHTPTPRPEVEPQYRPSAALSRLVKVRQPRCTFPACRQSSRHCDDEHRTAWPKGDTSPANLSSTSRWCHRRKQAGWTPTPMPDGSVWWTSPCGRQYVSPSQHEPPSPLPPGVRLPPPEPPPPRDDSGHADEDLDADGQPHPWATHDASVALGVVGAPVAAVPDVGEADRPGAPGGWPDDPPF